MPKTAKEFATEKKIRIYDLKVAQDIEKVLALGNPRYKSYNTVIVEAIKFGLPKIFEDIEPQSFLSDTVKKESDRVIAHTNRIYDKLTKQFNKLLVSVVLSQEMITCILNEVETLLSQNDITMTEEMRMNFINNLPSPLDMQYNELLDKLSNNQD